MQCRVEEGRGERLSRGGAENAEGAEKTLRALHPPRLRVSPSVFWIRNQGCDPPRGQRKSGSWSTGTCEPGGCAPAMGTRRLPPAPSLPYESTRCRGQTGGLEGEVVALRKAGRPFRGGAVVGDGALRIAQPLVQVRAD